jgi:hypothetical protein
MTNRQENPKHKQGDGAGFGRLRAEQHRRAAFQHLIRRSHPSGEIYIDQVREYAGVQVVFFRHTTTAFQHARVAIFEHHDGAWSKTNDIIATQE